MFDAEERNPSTDRSEIVLTNVVDGTDLKTAARHPEDFAEANDIIANLPIESETGV